MLSSHFRAWYPADESLQLCLQPPDMWLVPITPARTTRSGDIKQEATSATLSYIGYLHLFSCSTTGPTATNGTLE